jgi:hypothetical protein
MQLLEDSVEDTSSAVKSLKQRMREKAEKKTEEAKKWKDQTATIVVPSGEGRILILESPPSAIFRVSLWCLLGSARPAGSCLGVLKINA